MLKCAVHNQRSELINLLAMIGKFQLKKKINRHYKLLIDNIKTTNYTRIDI